MPKKNKFSTKADLIKTLSKKTNIDSNTSRDFVTSYFDFIKQALLKDQEVKLVDFGSYRVTKWKTQGVFDINTGKRNEMQIKSIKFKPSGNLKKKALED
jgi:nucleoid DNA-binding protein